MEPVLLLTLVHPDFLPPVYAMASALAEAGYAPEIITFESDVPPSGHISQPYQVHTIGRHAGSWRARRQARQRFRAFAQHRYEAHQRPPLLSFCDYTLSVACAIAGPEQVCHFALELTDASLRHLRSSPGSWWRAQRATRLYKRIPFLACPSQERAGWLAGRYKLEQIPHTVLNAPYVAPGQSAGENEWPGLLPPSFRNKPLLLHSGGVNGTRAVMELVRGFEQTASTEARLIITNVHESGYGALLREAVARSPRRDDILLLGLISRKELVALQSCCHIGVCLMRLSNGFDARMIAPNKVGEYLHGGMMVLGVETPYFSQFIPYQCVEMAQDLEASSIAIALDKLISRVPAGNYRQDIRRCLTEYYNMSFQLRPLFQHLWLNKRT